MIARTLPALAASILLAACGSQPAQPDQAPSRAGSTKAAPLTMIRSDSIALPDDGETFGDGAQAALLDTNCIACHSVTMIRYQPPLTAKQWTGTVEKMREAFHAPIDPAQTEAIVDALMALAPSCKD